MIILLSGNGKYSLDGENLERVFEKGRKLFLLLKEQKYEEFSLTLKEVHEFVEKNGKSVEMLKNADIIIPPVKFNPQQIREIFGLE